MQPRQYGGVVSPSLKVYGTANVRVVDVSVVPIHVSSHTQSVACASPSRSLLFRSAASSRILTLALTLADAIAEKAAALILAGQ